MCLAEQFNHRFAVIPASRTMMIARPRRCARAVAFALFSALFGAYHAAIAADLPPSFSTSGQAAARLLVHTQHLLKPAYWVSGTILPATPYGGDPAYELTADLLGRISCSGQDVLMLSLPGSNSSIDALAPHGFTPTWMDSGARLRLILRSNTQSGSSAGLGASGAAAYKVVAVALEVEVTAVESPMRGTPTRAAGYASRFGAARGISYQHSTPSSYPSAVPAAGQPVVQMSQRALAIYPYYRAAIARCNPRLNSSTVDKITSSVLVYSDYYHVDPRLIMAMIIAESGFNPNAVSRTGAMGLGQLMPGTAAGIRNASGLPVDPYDPIQNVGAAVKIISSHVSEYGGQDANGLVPLNTLLLTMAAYNAGGGAVRKYHGVPPYRETQNYVRRVSELYRRMCGAP